MVPEIARMVVVFPAPLAPSTTTILGVLDGQLDVMKYVDLPVPARNPGHPQQPHSLAPR